MRIVLLGAPGAGKGTLAKALSDTLGVPHLSAGDLLRDNVARGTPLGKKAKGFMDAGDLVPDGIVIEMMAARLRAGDCKGGFILDGFPRTLEQARALAGVTGLDAVVNITIPEAIIVERLGGRRVCPDCGAVYNIRNNPPKKKGVCDRCGAAVVVRDDDRPETIRKRFATYREKTAPLIEFYEAQGLVREVDSSGTVDRTMANAREALGL